jgi:hypothetical protein
MLLCEADAEIADAEAFLALFALEFLDAAGAGLSA